ncbi:bifunctional diguanylate cyclase/phosphohydrolase [Acetobacterium bakii]|uniref:Diguanylate cyclase n=1 Tax=Acetobacterium bakii TaxID=52689 RepID=A0A0L6TZS9_9FIRM|nr:HD domain-containing phosphohydrolase [Acetobacterium bakii]KNZ41769.1 diguanylate cyclase [Acetobacterium bakii]
MTESYKSKPKKAVTRESIIGLGEDSFKKNYYSELQNKLVDLEHSNGRTKALIATIPDILLISDVSGNIAPFGDTFKNDNSLVFKITANQTLINDLHSVISQVVETRCLITHHFKMIDDEKIHYFEARVHISEFDEVLIIIRDMTEQTLLETQLRNFADKDSLTDLYNRRFFESFLQDLNHQHAENLTLILMDIDGLKLVNDTLGHLAGDQVIAATSQLIKENFQALGTVSRVGGDEFGVIILNQHPATIELMLERLSTAVKVFNTSTDTISISLSFGYSHHKNGVANTDWLFQEADNNMYQNKLLKESSTRNNLVKTLMKALEVKDYITEGHANRMGNLATMIGQCLHLTQNRIDRLQLLSKFHDIGKVGIPDSILKKPTRLTLEEWNVMKTHCSIGERIANESSELKEISHLILKHQERWDGSGYPLGLVGKEIPIECRILSIVDAFDAMTNNRPYREALSISMAVQEIIEGSGTQFDPELVDLFKQIIPEYVNEL